MVWISAVVYLVFIACASYFLSRGHTRGSEGFFLAGRSLTGTFIAGSLLLTNISAEQIVGLAGSAYAFNFSSMAWEVTAVITIMSAALFLLPKFLARGFTTLPEYLGQRFGRPVQVASVILFLLGYGLVTIPSVLYSGTIAVLETFSADFATLLTGQTGFIVSMIVIALIGTAYTVAGGLRAVAVSDTLNGLGLVLFGFLIPILALQQVGDGSMFAGWQVLVANHPEKLNAIGSNTDPTPFITLFTGMLFANLAYWGTNQYVIQRTLAAKNLAAGQMGMLSAGFFKLLIPFFVMVPGVVAFHLYGPGLGSMDQAYPRLVGDILPPYLTGLFLAVLLGTVFSSFNSLLQSAATMITYDVYVPMQARPVNDAERVRVGRWACLAITVMGLLVAPSLQLAPEGLWQLIRKFTGFYNIPLISIVLAALFIPRASGKTAFGVILWHIPIYAVITFVVDTGIHFIHWYGILFVLEMAALATFRNTADVAKATANPTPAHTQVDIDLTPWRYRWVAVGLLCAGIICLYIILSPLGVAEL